MRIGWASAAVCGSVWIIAAAMWLSLGHRGVVEGLLRGVTAVGGSMAVGVLLGAVTGGALALSPEWLAARAPLRGLLAGAVASAVFLGEAVVVAAATGAGYAPVLLTLLAAPVVGAVAAVHSGDVLGRTHHHPWLHGRMAEK
ncbi:hypothetical protein [Streptomyces sp. NPDC000410]|uniref:hypothetical protein n=1 Tax=Streptomyces sp. NPDC000410 TaxID=3154254 RepID=UPI00331FAF82